MLHRRQIRVFAGNAVEAGGGIPTPGVSVIVPVYNQAGYILEALASIWRQDTASLEVIVVDDGSTDQTGRVLERCGFPFIHCRKAHGGPASARNHGLARARAGIIGFLDADDIWPAGRLGVLLQPLLADPGIDVVLGRIRCFPHAGKGVGAPAMSSQRFHGVQLGSGLFRRCVFDRVGAFDGDLGFSEDHDWFFRAREAGVRIVRMESDGLYHRVHARSLTRDGGAIAGFGLPRVIKASLDRRRGVQGGPAGSLMPFSAFETWEATV